MTFQEQMDKDIKEKRLYFIGEQLPPDWYAAFRQWLPIAEAGDAKAQYNVGRCYRRGNGVDQDLEQAHHWLLKSAEQEDPRAHFLLATLYEDKSFPKHNAATARQYLEKAIELGESRAKPYKLTLYLKARDELLKKIFIHLYRSEVKVGSDIAKIKSAIEQEISESGSELTSGWANDLLAALDLEITPDIQTILDHTSKVAHYSGNFIINNKSSQPFVVSCTLLDGIPSFELPKSKRDSEIDLSSALSQESYALQQHFKELKCVPFQVVPQEFYDMWREHKNPLLQLQLSPGATIKQEFSIKYRSDKLRSHVDHFQLTLEDKTVATLSDGKQNSFFSLFLPIPPTYLTHYRHTDEAQAHKKDSRRSWGKTAIASLYWGIPFFSQLLLFQQGLKALRIPSTSKTSLGTRLLAVSAISVVLMLYQVFFFFGLGLQTEPGILPFSLIRLGFCTMIFGYLFLNCVITPLLYPLLRERGISAADMLTVRHIMGSYGPFRR